jgi:hypothetical protein
MLKSWRSACGQKSSLGASAELAPASKQVATEMAQSFER